MLTLITGTPGAGKSLHAVWEFARHVPGSTIEVEGEKRPRRLLSNIKNLIIDHEKIDATHLDIWQEWAQPGDVIIFDEVQEVWRARAMGAKVPPCIAALETHRHMGVDIVLVTQHPNLLDQNIRRLVNQHLHLRRLTHRLCMIYEWDHCAEVKSIRNAIQSKLWWHPRKAYAMYKSAQAHTKPTAKMPRLAWIGIAAMAGLFYIVPTAYSKITGGKEAGQLAQAKKEAAKPVITKGPPPGMPTAVPLPPVPESVPGPAVVPAAVAVAGCVVPPAGGCACVDVKGLPVERVESLCASLALKRPVFDLAALVSASEVVDLRVPATDPGQLDMHAFLASNRGKSPSY
jgi:zona occludens toxin